MSKVVSSNKSTVSSLISRGGIAGYSSGLQMFSGDRTVKTVYTYSTQITIPEGVSSVIFKVWGAGGSAGRKINATLAAGGGAGFSQVTISTSVGDVYYVSVGVANGGGAGGTSSSGYFLNGGNGGGMSQVHFKSGLNYIVKAVAGGGGGGGAGSNTSFGGGGSGGGGGLPGYAGISVVTGDGGGAGSNGAGGAGGGGFFPGGSGVGYVDSVASITLDVGGSGGGGAEILDPAEMVTGGGGGGSGRGGGGGGAQYAGGGGGGNYSANGSVTDGAIITPGNNADVDYPPGVGVGGAENNLPGTDGAIVVIYLINLQTLFITDETTPDKASSLVVAASNNLRTDTGNGGDLYLNAGNAAATTPATKGSVILSGASVVPLTDNTTALGGPLNRWTTVYATTGTINTSDRREKADIEPGTLGLDFVNQLRPVRYRFLGGKRPHYGFIAQDVKETLDTLNLDFGGYVQSTAYTKDPDTGNEISTGDTLGLRYEEFISPIAKAVQELSSNANNDRELMMSYIRDLTARIEKLFQINESLIKNIYTLMIYISELGDERCSSLVEKKE